LKLEFDIREIEQLVIAKAVAIGINANACSITTRNGHFEKAVAWFDAKPANDAAEPATSDWVTVPETVLPDGRVVPSFKFAKYPCSKGADGQIVLDASAKPWVNIKFTDAVSACQAAGYQLTRETQELAIRLNVAQQDINWTGGKVGEGKLYQGIHKGKVSSAQAADYVSDDPEERSWHQLSNGERVFGLAGNVYTWVFDDVQGNDQGIVAGRIAKDSISLTTAPYPSREKGMGWRPDSDASWSGTALVRGGCWVSGVGAGVFRLVSVWPDYVSVGLGFRCTKP
jgi:hypothetical protein